MNNGKKLDNIDIEKHKELFEYDMTQVLLNLQGKFAFSNEEDYQDNEYVVVNPMELEVKTVEAPMIANQKIDNIELDVPMAINPNIDILKLDANTSIEEEETYINLVDKLKGIKLISAEQINAENIKAKDVYISAEDYKKLISKINCSISKNVKTENDYIKIKVQIPVIKSYKDVGAVKAKIEDSTGVDLSKFKRAPIVNEIKDLSLDEIKFSASNSYDIEFKSVDSHFDANELAKELAPNHKPVKTANLDVKRIQSIDLESNLSEFDNGVFDVNPVVIDEKKIKASLDKKDLSKISDAVNEKKINLDVDGIKSSVEKLDLSGISFVDEKELVKPDSSKIVSTIEDVKDVYNKIDDKIPKIDFKIEPIDKIDAIDVPEKNNIDVGFDASVELDKIEVKFPTVVVPDPKKEVLDKIGIDNSKSKALLEEYMKIDISAPKFDDVLNKIKGEN